MAAGEFNGNLHKKSEVWYKPGLQWSASTKEMGQQNNIHWLHAIVSSTCEVLYPCLCSAQKRK